MSRTLMKHLNNSRLVKHEHTHLKSIRKDRFNQYKDQGYEIISEGDDVYLIGKVRDVETTSDNHLPVVKTGKNTGKKK